MVAAIGIVLGTVVAMEAVAFSVHKYVMHGWGWGWHRSHHEPRGGLWEKNDLYGLGFAGLALAMIMFAPAERGWLYWIGVGMTAYGLLYFVVHDGLVHQRWPFRYVPRSGYLKRLVQAHRLHHAVEGRDGAVSFGFLYAPPVRRLKQVLQARHPGRGLDADEGERAVTPARSDAVDGFGRQAAVGLSLAALVIAAWLAVHVYGVFFHAWTPAGIVAAPLLIALQCWLDVGLFIVAHDAMHGSLAPFRPSLNRAVGRLCLALYAGFSYDRLIRKHFDHHRHSGTALDPDFHEDHPDRFWPWYLAFLRAYFGWREFAALTAIFWFYVGVLGASPLNMALLWGVPAILSSFQLFYFGTYLPHRHEETPFADRHHARSNEFSWLASLLSCFHFGYHHEHHEKPHVPWWQLPQHRRAAG